ncbi:MULTISPECIES: DctP family TRAP transporter solute-binding subunit [Paenibacillus]|uniref:C4-dicarboxylate ABC transporter n=1 Tax=Paenibacillus naphthalenovorans TaxID=162209 RepID=A0A0U2IMZ3_9BACL|nr:MULTISPECIES: DctP family TRAP transporter solute-binding subunit [Paenibacillus]ALS23707.1 C4-dicarboxylate ABC transporter [Paenibacillus naphthalenovorans]
MKKSILSMVFVLAASAALSACSSAGSSGDTGAGSGKTYEIKVAHAAPATNDRLEISLQEFKKEVEAKSNGAIKINTFPASQLGGEREQVEGVQLGSLHMAAVSTGPLPGIFKDSMVFDLPFLFNNEEQAYAVLDGPVGQELLQNMAAQTGIRGLAWGENGFRHFTNNIRPVQKPEDLKGLKIRTQENPLHMDMVKALAASPTPMAFGEVYSALQQGVIDGQENPISLIESMRFNEVNKYATLNGHVYSPYVLIINDAFYQMLPQDLQKVLADAAKNWSTVQRDLNKKQVDAGVENLKQKGMNIIELTDAEKDAFRNATKSVYDKYRNELSSGLIDKVLQAAEEAK